MRFFKPAIYIIFFSFAASSVFAADGAIEINEACVADGCFAGDNPGFPVEAVKPGKYILTSNLRVSGTERAISTGSDVSIDLNGFTVFGPGSCSAGGGNAGIRAGERNVIKNGKINGFCGVGIKAIGHSLVAGVTVTGNAGGGVRLQDAKVTDSVVVENGGDGIRAATSLGGWVENSLVADNQKAGISISSGMVRGNRVKNNGMYGLQANYSTDKVGYGNNQFEGNNGGASAAQVIGGYLIACNLVSQTVDCPQ